MSDIIYPRSPRETMCGWMHLPRYLDKVRLHLAGKLHPDYQPNFGKGFDQVWLELAGVEEKQFIDILRQSITDGEVCDWVLKDAKGVQIYECNKEVEYGHKQSIEYTTMLAKNHTKTQQNHECRHRVKEIRCFHGIIDRRSQGQSHDLGNRAGYKHRKHVQLAFY